MMAPEFIRSHVAVGERFTVPDLVDRLHPELGYLERIARIQTYRLRMAVISAQEAIDQLDEARGLVCAAGNPSMTALAALADHQDKLRDIIGEIEHTLGWME